MRKERDRRHLGGLGEQLAAAFLESKGFSILETNYRQPWGEIDIIARKDGIVRFVEVKAVSRESLPAISREMDNRPEELVHARKLEKVSRTAQLYMEDKQLDDEYQIDVVGVIISHKTGDALCRLFEQVL